MSEITKKNQEQEEIHQRYFVAPRVDVFENQDEFLLLAELPGVKSDNLHISFHDQQLTLEGLQNTKNQEDGAVGLEFQLHDFRRTFQIQQRIDVDKIEAKLEQGVATIRLPKAPETKARTIQIK
jgi:HSP20 family molecular chaperone IbpA